MRTLSVGVLIVCGGTLAALPFRRYQAIPDASLETHQVTGPTESALHSPPPDGGGEGAQQMPSLADQDAFGTYPTYASAHVPAEPPRRRIDIPLTYEDLSVPLDQPKPVMERFSATTSVRKKQVEQDRLAGLVMPPMEELPLHQKQEIERVAQSVSGSASDESRAAGRLASTSTPSEGRSILQPSEYQALPQPEERPKFWIHQPE